MAIIQNRFTENLICEEALLTIRQLVETNKSNLCGADLCGADLCGADLCGADLCGADLCDADLREADLCGADLCGADLCGADLRDADLRGADLCGADLCGADLRDADLCGADLRDADLCDADLRGAKNVKTLGWIDQARQQILFIFHYQPFGEVEGLRQKIARGEVDGTVYEGDCCCLIGSLGNNKAVSIIPYYKKGTHNIAEQLFYQIRKGDTPETNIFSEIALELCDKFLEEKTNNKQ